MSAGSFLLWDFIFEQKTNKQDHLRRFSATIYLNLLSGQKKKRNDAHKANKDDG